MKDYQQRYRSSEFLIGRFVGENEENKTKMTIDKTVDTYVMEKTQTFLIHLRKRLRYWRRIFKNNC